MFKVFALLIFKSLLFLIVFTFNDYRNHNNNNPKAIAKNRVLYSFSFPWSTDFFQSIQCVLKSIVHDYRKKQNKIEYKKMLVMKKVCMQTGKEKQ